MSQRLKDLKERLSNMQSFKANEMALPKKQQSKSYIADLNETIKAVEASIGHLEKHGESIEVMNGGGFV